MTPLGYAEDSDPRSVYTFLTADGSCLYVGCTVDFPRRLAAHRRERSWWGDVARIEVDIYPDLASGYAAETARIKTLNPVHNRVYTDHNTPPRRPCRTCCRSKHHQCIGLNARGEACPCSVCDRNTRTEDAA